MTTSWRFLMFAAALLLGAGSATAEKVYEVLGPSDGEEAVEVYADSEGEKVVGKLGREAFPLKAIAISPNLTIYIETKKLSGWVSPFQVDASFDPGDIGPCNYNFGSDDAGPRSIGKNCKNEKD